MADVPNGLASMTQARDRRARRAMPPPRHPVPATALTQTQPANNPAPDRAGPVLAVAEQANPEPPPTFEKAATPPPVKRLPARAIPVGEGSGAPKPTTLYLDNSHSDFLEEVHIAGLISRPRIDISRSAVVRLALRRLKHDMTIDEIRDHLSAQPTDPTKTGRKRR